MARTAISGFPLLIIDTASTDTHVGIGTAAGSWSWHASPEESGTSLFHGVDLCLKERQLGLDSIRTVIFCEGPGSLLGVRTAAMAIRTWTTAKAFPDTSVLAYTSLALAAQGVASETDFESIAVAIDARRKSWYCMNPRKSSADIPDIRRVPVDESETIASVVFLPKGFPIWNRKPTGWRECAYEPRWLERPDIREAILRPVDQPDAFMIDPPVYRRWTPTTGRSLAQLGQEDPDR